MKAIFLMGCAFCLAGSHGWASESDVLISKGESPTQVNSSLKRSLNDAEVGTNLKKIKSKKKQVRTVRVDDLTTGKISSVSTSEAPYMLSEEENHAEMVAESSNKHDHMVNEVSGWLVGELNSETSFDSTTVKNYIEKAVGQYNGKSDTPTNDALFEIFDFINISISNILFDKMETSERKGRAQKIRDCLKKILSSESSNLEEIEE